MHSLFKAAVRDRVIAYNPCEASTLPKVIKTRRDPLTPDQFERLLSAIPTQHRALPQVGIETGMRWGELAALRPRHLDAQPADQCGGDDRGDKQEGLPHRPAVHRQALPEERPAPAHQDHP